MCNNTYPALTTKYPAFSTKMKKAQISQCGPGAFFSKLSSECSISLFTYSCQCLCKTELSRVYGVCGMAARVCRGGDATLRFCIPAACGDRRVSEVGSGGPVARARAVNARGSQRVCKSRVSHIHRREMGGVVYCVYGKVF